MKIAEIGSAFKKTIKVSYFSDHSLLEYDAIIVNLNVLLDEGISQISLCKKRHVNLQEFTLHKQIPIIYFVPEQRSMPNRGHITISYPTLAPIPSFTVENEKGTLIKIIPATPVSDFLSKYQEYIRYRSYFTAEIGTRTMETQHTKRPLGFFEKECLFIPFFQTIPTELEDQFLKDLIDSAKKCSKPNLPTELPVWSKKFLLPKELEIKKRIQEINTTIQELSRQLEKNQIKIADLSKKKTLFTGTGDELEFQVEEVFKELGFEIIGKEPGREDLIVKYKDKIAVIEIKGVNKSAAERHAAQLEKWSASYFSANEIKPKPILIVNSFKETPLDERNEPSFPNQMLPYSIQREHCLLTSLQLLGFYYKVEENPELKDNLIEGLFATKGKYIEFENWREYISLESQNTK